MFCMWEVSVIGDKRVYSLVCGVRTQFICTIKGEWNVALNNQMLFILEDNKTIVTA